jgi:hypothetical protein
MLRAHPQHISERIMQSIVTPTPTPTPAADAQQTPAPIVPIAPAIAEAEGIKLQAQREQAADARIEALSQARQTWQDTVYKTSNDMLYGILAECYVLYHDMCGKTPQAAALREALKRKLAARNIKCSEGTHTMAKIVRCVFDGDRRRISAYSRALLAALTHKPQVPADGLAKFIADAGGVEELRLAKSPNFVPTAVKVEKAKAAIADKALAAIDGAALAQNLDAANVGAQYVLVASMQADGTLAVNAVLRSDTALKAALAAYYSTHKDAIAAQVVVQTVAKAEADKQQQMADLIEEAAKAA